MKTKTPVIILILWIFVLSVSSCSTVNAEQPVSRFTSNQATAVTSQSGPTDPLELEAFLDAYFAEQMSALHVPGATFVLVKDGDIFSPRDMATPTWASRSPTTPIKPSSGPPPSPKYSPWSACYNSMNRD